MRSDDGSVWELFNTDLAAWRRMGWKGRGSGKRGALLMLFHYNGLRATFIHRLASATHQRGIPALPSLLSQLNIALHGIEIPPSVAVGPGLYMPHTVGTVINARRIGAKVTLQGGITIGQKDNTGFPLVEDGVTLSAGCRILGNITVGAGSIIGANAVVLNDVPPLAVMVGVPARALMRDKPGGPVED